MSLGTFLAYVIFFVLKSHHLKCIHVYVMGGQDKVTTPPRLLSLGALFKRSIAHGLKCMAQVHLGLVQLHFAS